MSDASDPVAGRWRALALICAGVVGAMTCWFSATAVVPDLIVAWNLSQGQAVWLTNAVQIGFVLGALAASLVTTRFLRLM